MRPASRCTRVGAQTLVLFGAAAVWEGCVYDAGSDVAPVVFRETNAVDVLKVVQEPNAPVPVVHAELELSLFALEHVQSLLVSVWVNSGQALEQAGVVARWSSDPTVIAAQADFEGALSNTAQLPMLVASPPCETAPCVLLLELAPSGDWTSDVPFPIEYNVDARLTLDLPREREALESDLAVGLRVAP